ncbi:MAG: M14 family metallopeptidase [Nitrospinales bacterium]
MKKILLSIPSPMGGSITLYHSTWDGGALDETLSIVGGLHGNEINGFYITARLSRFLRSLAAGKEKEYRLQGKVRIVPVVNFGATQSGTRNWPFDELDLNLAFPGNESGEVGEQATAAILEHTAESAQGIILSSGANHYQDSPHVKLLRPNRGLKKTACHLGLDAVREVSDLPETHLLHQWTEQGIPSLMISAGKIGSLNRNYCESVFNGLVNLMLAMGLLSHSRERGKKCDATFYSPENEITLTSTHAGLFIPETPVGVTLRPGQKIGGILDMYTGETLEEIIAPANGGFLVSLRDYPPVYEKEPVAILLHKKKSAKFWPF